MVIGSVKSPQLHHSTRVGLVKENSGPRCSGLSSSGPGFSGSVVSCQRPYGGMLEDGAGVGWVDSGQQFSGADSSSSVQELTDTSTASVEQVPCSVRTCWQDPQRANHRCRGEAAAKASECDWAGSTRGSGPAAGASSQDSAHSRASRATITRGLLSTSGFVWVPLCRPSLSSRNSSVGIPEEVRNCTRLYIRRNALADPMQMALPQDTRERIQKEVAERKSSFTRKVSQYFKAMYTDDYEVDLY